MDKKLTLSLNQHVIEKAKSYAKRHGTSLSKMIETYFDSLTSKQEEKGKIKTTPLVESLCGVVQLPVDFNFKKVRTKYLLDKYK